MKNNDFEIRTATLSAADKKLVGYAVKWNSRSEVLWDEFVEQFAPNAFKDSLAAGADVRALYEHDYTALLGRNTSGTLVLSEDANVVMETDANANIKPNKKKAANKIDPAVAFLMSFGTYQLQHEEFAFDLSEEQQQRLAAFNGI